MTGYATNNTRNSAFRHIEFGGEFSKASALGAALTQVCDLLIAQTRHVMSLAVGPMLRVNASRVLVARNVQTVFARIGRVLLGRCQIQMVGVHAPFAIAAMADAHSCGDGSVVNSPRQTTSYPSFTLGHGLSIPLLIGATFHPLPTSVITNIVGSMEAVDALLPQITLRIAMRLFARMATSRAPLNLRTAFRTGFIQWGIFRSCHLDSFYESGCAAPGDVRVRPAFLLPNYTTLPKLDVTLTVP